MVSSLFSSYHRSKNGPLHYNRYASKRDNGFDSRPSRKQNRISRGIIIGSILAVFTLTGFLWFVNSHIAPDSSSLLPTSTPLVTESHGPHKLYNGGKPESPNLKRLMATPPVDNGYVRPFPVKKISPPTMKAEAEPAYITRIQEAHPLEIPTRSSTSSITIETSRLKPHYKNSTHLSSFKNNPSATLQTLVSTTDTSTLDARTVVSTADDATSPSIPTINGFPVPTTPPLPSVLAILCLAPQYRHRSDPHPAPGHTLIPDHDPEPVCNEDPDTPDTSGHHAFCILFPGREWISGYKKTCFLQKKHRWTKYNCKADKFVDVANEEFEGLRERNEEEMKELIERYPDSQTPKDIGFIPKKQPRSSAAESGGSKNVTLRRSWEMSST